MSILKPQSIQSVYLYLTVTNTLAASFIWGINTIFLLDAGLSNFQAFAANAFFTAGQVIFEVPTGIVADMWGRRISYQQFKVQQSAQHLPDEIPSQFQQQLKTWDLGCSVD